MRNHNHTPELAGTLTAYHFPSGNAYVFLGDKDVADTEEWKYNPMRFSEGYSSFMDAFWQTEGEWTVIYTEHFGYHSYRSESVIEVGGQEGPKKLTQSVLDMLDNPLDTEL